MHRTHEKAAGGFFQETGRIFRHARHVWHLIPRSHKLALGGAALLMGLVSACNTALPLLLGQLLDGVKKGTDKGLAGSSLYQIAGLYLGLIALAYLLREVLRRFTNKR